MNEMKWLRRPCGARVAQADEQLVRAHGSCRESDVSRRNSGASSRMLAASPQSRLLADPRARLREPRKLLRSLHAVLRRRHARQRLARAHLTTRPRCATSARCAGAPRCGRQAIEPRRSAQRVRHRSPATTGRCAAAPARPTAVAAASRLLAARRSRASSRRSRRVWLLVVPPSRHLRCAKPKRMLIAALNAISRDDGIALRRAAIRSAGTCASATPLDAASRMPVERVRRPQHRTHLLRGAEARAWQRWLNEMQMLLHAHPVNAAREARGEPPSTASGSGAAALLPTRRDPAFARVRPAIALAAAALALAALRAPTRARPNALRPCARRVEPDDCVVLDGCSHRGATAGDARRAARARSIAIACAALRRLLTGTLDAR